MTLYKDFKVSKLDCAVYAVFNIAANYIGSGIVMIAGGYLLSLFRIPVISEIFAIVFNTLAPVAILAFLFHRRVSYHFIKESTMQTVMKSYLLYVITGEIVRLIICIVPIFGRILPFSTFGVLTAGGANMLFSFYSGLADRTLAIGSQREYIVWDFIVYFFVHIIYLAVYMLASFVVYRFFWNRAEKEYKELTRYQRKD